MEAHRSLAVLSEVVAQLEQEAALRSVETVVEGGEDEIRATVEVPVSLCHPAAADGGDAQPVEAAMTPAGHLEVTYANADAILPSVDVAAVTVTDRSVRVTEDTGLVASLGLRITPPEWAPPESGPAVAVDSPSGTSSAQGVETPAPDASGTDARSVPGDDDPDEDATADDADDLAAPEVAENAADAAEADDVAATLAAVRDSSVPPYEDVPYLEALYDTCDTFAAMSEAMVMDVSGETVRRYMIEAGVHEPDRYDTGDSDSGQPADVTGAHDTERDGAHDPKRGEAHDIEGEDEEASGEPDRGEVIDDRSPAQAAPSGEERGVPTGADVPPISELVAEGIELPDDVEMADVVDAVVNSRSIHEVARTLELDHAETRALLTELDLIDLVSFRIADAGDHETSYETVTSRLRRRSPEVA